MKQLSIAAIVVCTLGTGLFILYSRGASDAGGPGAVQQDVKAVQPQPLAPPIEPDPEQAEPRVENRPLSHKERFEKCVAETAFHIEPSALRKVEHLYPEVRRKPSMDEPFFVETREFCRIRADDGSIRLVILVRTATMASYHFHGQGAYHFFADAGDREPAFKLSIFHLPKSGLEIVNRKWLKAKEGTALILLTDAKWLEDLKQFSSIDLCTFAREAVDRAFAEYCRQGRSAFLKRLSTWSGGGMQLNALPERIREAELYPTLARDMRPRLGKVIYRPWSCDVYVRITPVGEKEEPLILALSGKGPYEGMADYREVKLSLQPRRRPLVDRPAPGYGLDESGVF